MLRFTLLCLLSAALAHADGGDVQIDVERAELQKRESARAVVEQSRSRLQTHTQTLAAEVDRLKLEPAGVRRDLRLGDLLATAKVESDQLEGLSVELRRRASLVAEARRALVAACDRALTTELPAARRLELVRMRTAQVTLLAEVQSGGRVVSGVDVDPLDGPRELLDKADLLRDSGDKLRREVKRLAMRIDDTERRRHLRERASAVDEDLFGDAAYNRRAAQPASSSTARADSNASAAPVQLGAGGITGPATVAGGSEGTVVLRNLVDPTTLEELRRADGSDDFERKVRALRRAQAELDGLARELDRRAQTLSSKAAALRNQK